VKDTEVQDSEKLRLGFSKEPEVASLLQPQSSGCAVQQCLTESEMVHARWKVKLVQAQLYACENKLISVMHLRCPHAFGRV